MARFDCRPVFTYPAYVERGNRPTVRTTRTDQPDVVVTAGGRTGRPSSPRIQVEQIARRCRGVGSHGRSRERQGPCRTQDDARRSYDTLPQHDTVVRQAILFYNAVPPEFPDLASFSQGDIRSVGQHEDPFARFLNSANVHRRVSTVRLLAELHRLAGTQVRDSYPDPAVLDRRLTLPVTRPDDRSFLINLRPPPAIHRQNCDMIHCDWDGKAGP